ncbi:phospholipase D family protein [Pseudooceanicola marinus]|uniref:phospholipase D family protein n=1 Tax=Pseudooceanicola marinus TaxID=396013 RepID=UPI001CD7A680|nr:phospholipase D family protein [Pseudooceanicola marinus]MCA1336581.1 phospholipase D-like domain-containing protein [Pseudooceanicola marinus]
MPKDTRHQKDLIPLVTAAEMFPALETLCLQAKSEVLMSFRIFDPRTRLHSAEAEALELKTWADLVAHVAARGVKMRLLIADFDPVFTPDLHRDAWDAGAGFAAGLLSHTQAEDTAEFHGAEVLVAQHQASAAPVWKRIFGSRVRASVEDLRQRNPERLTPLQLRALSGDVTLRPASLHQKLAVADGRQAIIGGLDVDERRWDDESHEQRAEDTWHDVSLRVSGAVAGDIRRHFADCWSRAQKAGAASFAAEASPVESTAPLPDKHMSAMGPRLLRTQSQPRRGPLRLGPKPAITEHEEAHLAAFDSAEKLIYLESQFFRHMPLARALARAAERAPRLNCILVLPTEPERVIFNGDTSIDARHELALQLRCLNHVRRAFGDRLAVVAPAQPRPAPRHTPKPLYGAGVIYLHSKVTLVDDKLAILGSANLNGRSMRWDTEASLQFHDTASIRALRKRLMKSWLQDHMKDIDPHCADDWTALAHAEAGRDPEARSAHILPWPERRNRRLARFLPVLPPEMF